MTDLPSAASTPAPPVLRPPLAPSGPFASTDQIRELADAFERCDLPRAAWTHDAHLAVALWYLVCYGPTEGGERVRAGIQRFNAAKGGPQTPDSGYHETITRFYLWAVRRHLRDAPRDSSIADLANALVAAWRDRDRPLEYYSRERLFSREARTRWLEPDLKPLD